MSSRMLCELVAEVCPEAERNLPREQRSIRVYRVVFTTPRGRLDTDHDFRDFLRGKFLLVLRVFSVRYLRKAKRTENELFREITDITGEHEVPH
jgi:hypothetical protein